MKPQNPKATDQREGAPSATQTSYSGGSAKSSNSLQRGVWTAILALGWLSFVLIVLALGAEHHPRLERWIASAVADRVEGPLGEDVTIEDVDILWLKRSVEIRELSMGPSSGDRIQGGLVGNKIRLRFGWAPGTGFHADRVDVDGGSIVISPDLSRGLGSGTDEDTTGSTVDLLAKSPEVALRNLSVALVLEDQQITHLGTANLSLTQPNRGESEAPEAVGTRIAGRFTPSIATETDAPPPGGPAIGDEGGYGTIWLSGTVGDDRVARVRGVAKSIQLSLDSLEHLAPVEALARFEPEALLDLSLEATYEIGRSLLPAVDCKVRVSDGGLVLPWLKSARSRPVKGVDLLAEVGFDAGEDGDPTRPSAWRAVGTLSAEWEELQGAAAFRAGTRAPENSDLEVWLDLPGAPLGERLSELSAGLEGIVEIDRMLAPQGSADVSIGVRLPSARVADQPVGRSLERLLLIRARGDASLAYHGGIDRRTGRRDVGFPLPVKRVVGDVTWSIRPEGRFPGQLAFYNMTGSHSGGPISVQGSLHFTPIWRFADESLVDLVPTPFHLSVKSERLPLNQDFETAMIGLYGVPEVRELIPTWNPGGGSLDLNLELWRTIHRRELSMDLDAQLDGVGFRWRELPIPIEGSDGSIRIRTDGGGPERGRVLVQLDLEAESPIARDPFHVVGRVAGEGAPDGNPRTLNWFELDARRVNVRAQELREEVARKNPEAAASLEAVGVAGFVDVSLTAVNELPSVEAAALRASLMDDPDGANLDVVPYLGGMKICAEVRPHDRRQGLTVQPIQFPIVTREVEGRLLATSLLPPDILADADTPEFPYTALAADMQGLWRQVGPSVPVAVRVSSEGPTPGRLVAMGAGLDIANRSLVGSLTNAARQASSTTGGMDPVDTDEVEVAGRVDFAAEMTLPESPGLPTTDNAISVEARLEKLGVGGDQVLRDVSAHFRLDGDTEEWIGEEIDARLGTTPIELSGVVYQPVPGGSTLRANLSAQGLPIDREHLSFFLDEDTLRTVLDDLRAKGSFDIEDAELELTERRDGTRHVELDGKIRIEDAFIDLGAPIEVTLVESMDLHLNHEGKELRSRATIDGLFGAIAGRRLENARMQMTYVGSRLVIEAFDGGFEGGRLRALGSDVANGADLFAIDLKAPFPFRLAAQMSDVDIGEFLRGVFDSNFANRGVMNLSMRLAGDFEHLIDMRGGGEIRVKDSALWAIPVFRALSQRLGIDTTVLFREMLCDYTIEDGSLAIDRMRVDSDLMSLVGTGLMTFEGDVTSDLEVRYSLVDKLGPLTRLLYYIQNSLLRVSIRGTMDRPTVVLRGLISQLFAPSDERDRLPLPGFSERPKRF